MSDQNTEQTTEETQQEKSWLQTLKEQSWEAELLVSGIAIIGAFQLFDFIRWATNMFIDKLDYSQYGIGYFITFFGLFAVSILVSMFVIHFFLRAYWVGLVGLNSVFPDYSVEDSAYSKIYTEKLLATLPKLKDSIEKVDELCSVIFSVAFTFLLLYMYSAFTATIYLFIYNALSDKVNFYILILPLVISGAALIGQTVLGVVANIKKNKENERIQTWFFKGTTINSKLMYGPLYRPITQVFMIFGSNFKKKKSLVYLILLFVVSGICMSVYQVTKSNIFYFLLHDTYFDETRSNLTYYASENKQNTFLLNPEIESDKIQSNTTKLFIPIFGREGKLRKDICGREPKDEKKTRKELRKVIRQYYLDCYTKYNHVYLNKVEVVPKYLKSDHPITKQFGIICYLDLSNLSKGMNEISVVKKYNDKDSIEWVIPFYYEAK